MENRMVSGADSQLTTPLVSILERGADESSGGWNGNALTDTAAH